MKKKIIELIKILGFGVDELVITISLTIGVFDSIEWDRIDDSVYLHMFKEDIDMSFDFEDLSEEDQLMVYSILSVIYN